MSRNFTRRDAIVLGMTAAAGLAAPSLVSAQAARRNTSSFSMQNWRDHFDDLGKASIATDTASRALHFWNHDGSDYRIYPTSVPNSEELTKRGNTEIMRKKVGPSWTPTQSQLERYPDWEPIGPGPDNPLGTHAMYLSWPAYIIHGTHDTRKIGRRFSDGFIGLYNSRIEGRSGLCPIGTQVRVI